MSGENILIVDDEKNILDSLSGILSDEGYNVMTAENGDDALEILEQIRCDLILLDIWLPGRRDGLQTLREIRKRNLDTEVIMISGHGSIDTAVRATKLGAFDFMEKPLSLNNILETIEAALEHGRMDGESEDAVGGLYSYLGECPDMKKVKKEIQAAAMSGGTVVTIGEPGSGKEFTARYLHSKSAFSGNPFIKVACRQLTVSAFDRLFGSPDDEPSSKDSRFSRLTGCLFLENPNLLDETLQKRLADYIKLAKKGKEGGKLIFTATMTVSPGDKKSGGMEKSLSAVFKKTPVKLPPLRDRGSDIELLIKYFIGHASEDFGKAHIRVSKKAMKRMMSYPWPGNVKELQSVVENMIMACSSPLIEPDDIPFGGSLEAVPDSALEGRVAPRGKGVKKGARAVTQKTLRKSVVLCGLGLHSGIKTGLILAPLPVNSGIIFGDISTGRQVMALLDNVKSTEYSTTLTFGGTSVKTIEHIMATLHMCGITNALIKVGEEVPIMDGSAVEFCKLTENAGIVDQGEILEPIVIKEKFTVGECADNKKFITIEPSKRLEIEYKVDYPQPVGRQSVKFKANGIQDFKTQIAPARTFGFVKHIKEFEGKGFAQGGKLTNVILMDDERVINTTLRFEDEFARHKILDLLGDMYLLGRPIVGKITANMTGHTDNIELLKAIQSSLGNTKNGVAAGT